MCISFAVIAARDAGERPARGRTSSLDIPASKASASLSVAVFPRSGTFGG